MSDRLSELRRQRALLQEHLAWLDREIAAASKPAAVTKPLAVASVANPLPTPILPATPAPPIYGGAPSATDAAAMTTTLITQADPAGEAESAQAAAAEAILDEYRPSSGSVQQDVRKGCLLYFVGAFALLGLGVAVLYLLISKR